MKSLTYTLIIERNGQLYQDALNFLDFVKHERKSKPPHDIIVYQFSEQVWLSISTLVIAKEGKGVVYVKQSIMFVDWQEWPHQTVCE